MQEPVIIYNNSPRALSETSVIRARKGGRPKGAGRNLKVLAKLKPGDERSCIWGCTYDLMARLRDSAKKAGILLAIRKLEDGTYALWRLS